jgi:hypothetical protein
VVKPLKFAPKSRARKGTAKEDAKFVGIRIDLAVDLEREAYTYIESLKGEYTPRQIIVAALVAASRENYHPVINGGINQDMVYQAVVEAMRQVIGDGQIVVSNGALAVQNTDGSTRAIMSQEAKNLLGFVDELGEF